MKRHLIAGAVLSALLASDAATAQQSGLTDEQQAAVAELAAELEAINLILQDPLDLEHVPMISVDPDQATSDRPAGDYFHRDGMLGRGGAGPLIYDPAERGASIAGPGDRLTWGTGPVGDGRDSGKVAAAIERVSNLWGRFQSGPIRITGFTLSLTWGLPSIDVGFEFRDPVEP